MNSKSLLAVVLLVALGLVAWLLSTSTDDVSLPGAGRPAEGAAATAPPPAPAPATAAAAPAAATESAPAGAAAVDRTAVPTQPAPAAADGGAHVLGRIVGADGSPRAGVQLSLTSWSLSGDLPERVMPAGVRPGSGPTATTGADGRFRFPLAADRSASLSLVGDELVFARARPHVVGKATDQDLGDLVVIASAQLAGVVKDANGRPVADVKVSADLSVIAIGSNNSATTDAAGQFAIRGLEAGKWHLRTASAKYLPATLEVDLKDSERRHDLALVVTPGLSISGRVVDDLGQPVAGCRVGAMRKETRGGLDIQRFATDEAATTDARGFFTLTGLEGEVATVRASGPGHAIALAPAVPVGTGDLVLRVDRLATIVGTLVGADGGPIAGSRVRASSAGADGPVEGPQGEVEAVAGLGLAGLGGSARTGVDGSFRIEGVRPGTVTLSAEGDGHRPVEQAGLHVRPAQVVEGVRLVAERGAVASVTVVDDAGKPVAGAKVTAQRPSERPADGDVRMVRRAVSVEDTGGDVRIAGIDDTLGSATTGADGKATIPGLPAETLQITASHADFAQARPALLAMPAVGVAEANLSLRRGGGISVRVVDTAGAVMPAAAFACRGPLGTEEESVTRGTTDAQGQARVWPLVPGAYEVELRRPAPMHRFGDARVVLGGDDGGAIEGASARCTVLGGEDARVDLVRPAQTRLFGVVTGPDGPVAQCNLDLEKEGVPARPELPGFGGGVSATTGADGTFEFEGVEGGRYTIRYGREGAAAKAEAEVEVLANQLEQRVDLELRTGTLRVQAWSKVDNAPVAGAEVEITPAASGAPGRPQRREQRVMMISVRTDSEDAGDSTAMTMGGRQARTGADGWCELPDVPAGLWNVRVTHKKHVAGTLRQQAVVQGQSTDCGRVELAQAGRIRGKVLTAGGDPVRMALVFQRPAGGGEDAPPQPAMGGQFTFDGLAPGKYVLRAQGMNLAGGGPGDFGPEVEVEVKAGETAAAEVHLAPK